VRENWENQKSIGDSSQQRDKKKACTTIYGLANLKKKCLHYKIWVRKIKKKKKKKKKDFQEEENPTGIWFSMDDQQKYSFIISPLLSCESEECGRLAIVHPREENKKCFLFLFLENHN
jgi:hypothetical protein